MLLSYFDLRLRLALSDVIANQIHDRELAPMSYGPNKGKPIHIPGKESFKAISEAQGKPPREALERVIREEFSRACGRPITKDEFPKYLAFMERNLAQGGNEAGLKTTLLGIYLSSEEQNLLNWLSNNFWENKYRFLATNLVYPNYLKSKTVKYIVLELVGGGELFDLVALGGKLEEKYARFYFKQLIEGLDYIHK